MRRVLVIERVAPCDLSGYIAAMRAAIATVLLLLVVASTACAQEWSFGVSGFLFAPPEDDAYFSPVAWADRERLHLETRYNYENLETGSLFVGFNFQVGDAVALAATPIVGGVFGETNGIAPGLDAELTWRQFALSTESEYVFDLENGDDSFFYMWSEMTYAPTRWLRAGLVAQKTETYQTGLDVQRGVMAGASRGAWSLGTYWFNPDRSDDGLFVGSLTWEF